MRGPTTDTTFKRLAPGFVVTEAGTKTFPWIKDFASQYSSTEEEMKRGVDAIVTNGETYIPMSGIRALGNGSVETGVDTLREMNNKPREGGHSAIDQLMVMNTLKNLKPMYGGGEITPTNYANGGMVGYQEGDVVQGAPAQPQPQPQPQNNLQIDERQANPQMYQGSTLGSVQEQAMMLQESIEADTVNKARKTLELLKLRGLLENAEAVEYQNPPRSDPRMIPTPNEADQIRNMMIGNFSI